MASPGAPCRKGRQVTRARGPGNLVQHLVGGVRALPRPWHWFRRRDMECTVWFSDGLLNEQRTRLHALVLEQGGLRFRGCFSAQTWMTDAFVMFHNAVRGEVQDLYSMLRAAAFRVETLRAGDVGLLENWVVEFGQLVSMYVVAQERVIYPAVVGCVGAAGMHGVSVGRVSAWARDIVSTVVHVHGTVVALGRVCRAREDERDTRFDMRSAYEGMGAVCAAVRDMVRDMEALFGWEVEVMGGVVQRGMRREEVWAVAQRCVAEVLQYEVGERVWGAVGGGMPPQVRDALEALVGGVTRARVRRKERRWLRNHKALHLRFASR